MHNSRYSVPLALLFWDESGINSDPTPFECAGSEVVNHAGSRIGMQNSNSKQINLIQFALPSDMG